MDPFTAVIGGALVIVTNALTAFFSRSKSKADVTNVVADSAEVVTGTAMRLMDQMEKRITDLETRLTNTERREQLGLERERALALRIADLNDEVRELRRTDTARIAREDTASAVQAEADRHPIPPIEVHLVHEPAPEVKP